MLKVPHKTLQIYQSTVWPHVDIAIPENRGFIGTSSSNNSYEENLAHNWSLVLSKIFHGRQMKGPNFF